MPLRFIYNGVIWNWEDHDNKGADATPNWTIPIHISVSLVIGTLLTLYLEEPARKKLKEWREKKKQINKDRNDQKIQSK